MPKPKKATVPEAPPAPPRSLDVIQSEYASLCGQLGDREYRRRVLDAEITAIAQQMQKLNHEAASLPKETP